MINLYEYDEYRPLYPPRILTSDEQQYKDKMGYTAWTSSLIYNATDVRAHIMLTDFWFEQRKDFKFTTTTTSLHNEFLSFAQRKEKGYITQTKHDCLISSGSSSLLWWRTEIKYSSWPFSFFAKSKKHNFSFSVNFNKIKELIDQAKINNQIPVIIFFDCEGWVYIYNLSLLDISSSKRLVQDDFKGFNTNQKKNKDVLFLDARYPHAKYKLKNFDIQVYNKRAINKCFNSTLLEDYLNLNLNKR